MGNYTQQVSCQTGVIARLTGARRAGQRRVRTCLAILVTMLLLCGTQQAFSQAQNTGAILGSVTDPTGAVIAGATIVATDTEKGFTRTVTSGKSGDYLLPDIPVGTYILTVSAPNFETFVETGVAIDADKTVKVIAKMTIGDQKTSVSVEGEGTAIDTNSATIATLIDTKLVENLPIDGNNVVALAGLLPGVTDLNAPATNTSDRGGPTFSVSGSRNTQNLMLFDGLMWNNLFYNTGINYPPPNGLQEISVLLNNFKAQYGRNAGSVFNVVTKRGSNQLHGVVWEYFQNKYFNASDYLSHINPKDNSNQFGFTVGGPIKKDKAYFQLTFQDLIQKLQVVGTDQVPDYAERGLIATCPNGNYSIGGTSPNAFGCPGGVAPSSVALRPCQSPGPFLPSDNCASFADNLASTTGYKKFTNPELITPSTGLGASPTTAEANLNSAWYQAGNTGTSPCIQQLNNAATYAGLTTSKYLDNSLEPNYITTGELPSSCLNPVLENVAGLRGTNNGILQTYVPFPNGVAANLKTVSGIASNTNPNGILPGVVSTAPQPRNDYNVLARIDYILNSRHTIDARYNLIDASDATAPGVNSSSVGIATFELSNNTAVSNFGNIGDTWVVTPNILNVFRIGYKRYVTASPPSDSRTLNSFGGNFVEVGPPVMPSIGTSAYTLGTTTQALSNIVNENIEILEQLSWTHGNHNFQFGLNFLRLQYDNNSYNAGKLSSSTNYTADPLADQAAGFLSAVTANSLLQQAGINHSIFAYAQDDWRATPKLTFNLGVRYELPFQWYQPTGYSSTFIPGHQSTVFPTAIGGLAYPGDPGVLSSLVPTDFNGLVPRLGFAYDIFGTGRIAIRGGFGMFFDAINANVVGVGEPFYFQLNKQIPPGGISAPLASYGTNPADTRPNGNNYVVPSAYQKGNPQFLAPYTLFYPDRNFRTPYYEAFNLGFQAHVARGGVLDVNYVGKLGRKLTIPYDQNPAITDCSGGYYQANPQLYASASCPYLVPGSIAGGATNTAASYAQRVRYTPFNYGGSGLVDFSSIGTSNYNGFQAQYTQRGGKHLTLLASYSYSKSIDLQTQSQTVSNTIPNVYNLASERGVSDFDSRHVLNAGWVFTTPRVTQGPAFFRTLLSEWIYGGIFRAHSGRPFDVTINGDFSYDDEPNQRASIIPGMNPKLPSNRHRTAKIAQWFNTAAFNYPTFGTFSNQQRNDLVGPAYLDTDMNFGRYIPLNKIRSGMRMLLRADAYNVWNTPNLANPQATYSCSSTQAAQPASQYFGQPCNKIVTTSATTTTPAAYAQNGNSFGAILSTYGNNGNTSTNGRKMQFNMTIYF